MNTAKCEICRKKFSNIYTFKTHVRKFHPDAADKLAPRKRYKFRCQDCGKNFSHLKNFKHHRSKLHGDGIVKSPTFKKKCPLCDYCGSKAQELNDHFINIHEITLQVSQHCFSSKDNFIAWKEKVETETNARFVKYKGTRMLSNAQQSVDYVCHRSGTFTSKSKGLRLLKSQGSNKINGFCPAAVKVLICENEICKVTFCETHVGHENDLTHLFLNPSEKEQLAAEIAKNVWFSTILKQVHNTQQNSRLCLLKRRDLHNIKQSLERKSTSHIKKDDVYIIKSEEGDVEPDLLTDDDNVDCVESHRLLDDHDYVGSRQLESPSNLSLSEEKNKLQDSFSKIISSVNSMEEIEALRQIIDDIQPVLDKMRNSKQIEDSSVNKVTTTHLTKNDDKMYNSLIIVKSTQQISLHNLGHVK